MVREKKVGKEFVPIFAFLGHSLFQHGLERVVKSFYKAIRSAGDTAWCESTLCEAVDTSPVGAER